MRSCSTMCAVVAALVVTACGDNLPPATATTPDASGDAGPYMGPTKNGSPEQPQLPDEPVATGPYDAAIPCCATDLTFDAPAGGTVVVQGKLAPFDGAGLSLTHNGASWEAAVCIPIGLTMDFHYLVTPVGEPTTTQIDSQYASYEDQDGVAWNRLLLDTCN